MSLPSTSTRTTHEPGTSDTHLRGRWLLIARVGWIALTLLILIANASSIPAYDALLQSVCQPETQCFTEQLQPHDLHLLQQDVSPPHFPTQVDWNK